VRRRKADSVSYGFGFGEKGEGLEEELDECCLVIYKDGENLNSEGIGRTGKFIYCQYSRWKNVNTEKGRKNYRRLRKKLKRATDNA
jgi:hypothetical protein